MLYPSLLKLTRVVLLQVKGALLKVNEQCEYSDKMLKWKAKIEHHRDLLLKFTNQTERRVVKK
jgi:hypothetical protein